MDTTMSSDVALESKDKDRDGENKPEKDSKKDADSCYRYDENNVLIYTDPSSKKEYVLNSKGSDWIPREEAAAEAQKDYEFDGQTYKYTDSEGNSFKWDVDAKEWKRTEENEKSAKSSSDESEIDDTMTEEERKKRQYRKRKAHPDWGRHQANYSTDPTTGAQLYRDPSDGMTYEWDSAKNAWFPRIDEDFMAQYQMNYGFTPDGRAEPTRPEEPKKEEPNTESKDKSKNSKDSKPKWFEEDEVKSTKVYVSNLPDSINESSLVEFMSKCGMLDVDVRAKSRPKVKIYRDEEGRPKGDALATYVKVESVQLALQILDGAMLDGKEIRVERAKFTMRGDRYDPSLKPKKLRKKELEMLKKKREKMFVWEPDKLRGERSKRDKVIVVKNLFNPKDFDKANAELILEYSSRLRNQCSRLVGNAVRRVVVYDKHPEGVAQVFFNSPAEADQAVAAMDGRIFHGSSRVMKVETWDGKTKYRVEETEEEEKERLANWDKFLEGDEGDSEKSQGQKTASDNEQVSASDKTKDSSE